MGIMVLGVSIKPAPAAIACTNVNRRPQTVCMGLLYQIRLSITQTLCGQVNRDKAAAAASVDGDARTMEVEGVGYSIGHNGNPITGSSILRLPVGVTEADLFVVYDKSVFALPAQVPNWWYQPLTNEPTYTAVSLPYTSSFRIPATQPWLVMFV